MEFAIPPHPTQPFGIQPLILLWAKSKAACLSRGEIRAGHGFFLRDGGLMMIYSRSIELPGLCCSLGHVDVLTDTSVVPCTVPDA